MNDSSGRIGEMKNKRLCMAALAALVVSAILSKLPKRMLFASSSTL